LADAINGLACSLNHVAYAPGWSAKRDRQEQAEAVATKRLGQKLLTPEQLRIARQRAGMPVPPRYPQPSERVLEVVNA
jgi:hypothetical protein